MKASTGRAIEVSHRVRGTPDVVFPYFTDSEKYRLWKGLDAELDARPGGIYRVNWNGASVEGEYLVVEPPHRLVFTWGWRGNPLPAGFADVPAGSTTVEVTFVPDGDGTIIRLRHTGLPSEDAFAVHGWGWTTYLRRLEIVRAGGDPGPQPDVVPAPAELRHSPRVADPGNG
jgi:uncharacterized protein YndB with AHSA1/START domain